MEGVFDQLTTNEKFAPTPNILNLATLPLSPDIPNHPTPMSRILFVLTDISQTVVLYYMT